MASPAADVNDNHSTATTLIPGGGDGEEKKLKLNVVEEHERYLCGKPECLEKNLVFENKNEYSLHLRDAHEILLLVIIKSDSGSGTEAEDSKKIWRGYMPKCFPHLRLASDDEISDKEKEKESSRAIMVQNLDESNIQTNHRITAKNGNELIATSDTNTVVEAGKINSGNNQMVKENEKSDKKDENQVSSELPYFAIPYIPSAVVPSTSASGELESQSRESILKARVMASINPNSPFNFDADFDPRLIMPSPLDTRKGDSSNEEEEVEDEDMIDNESENLSLVTSAGNPMVLDENESINSPHNSEERVVVVSEKDAQHAASACNVDNSKNFTASNENFKNILNEKKENQDQVEKFDDIQPAISNNNDNKIGKDLELEDQVEELVIDEQNKSNLIKNKKGKKNATTFRIKRKYNKRQPTINSTTAMQETVNDSTSPTIPKLKIKLPNPVVAQNEQQAHKKEKNITPTRILPKRSIVHQFELDRTRELQYYNEDSNTTKSTNDNESTENTSDEEFVINKKAQAKKHKQKHKSKNDLLPNLTPAIILPSNYLENIQQSNGSHNKNNSVQSSEEGINSQPSSVPRGRGRPPKYRPPGYTPPILKQKLVKPKLIKHNQEGIVQGLKRGPGRPPGRKNRQPQASTSLFQPQLPPQQNVDASSSENQNQEQNV